MNKLKSKISKYFVFVLTLIIAIFAVSCQNWMNDDGFKDKIETEVHDANAAPVSVYVRYANSKMGTTEPSGYTTMKVDVAAEITAVTNEDYGFVRWAAFSTKDFPSNKQHSNLFYESAEKYAKDFKSKELPASEVSFEDPKNPSTTVKINTTRSDIFITPLVAKRPAVVTSVPSNGRADVVKNSQVRILFSKPIDEKSLKDEFGNSNIVVTSGSAVLTESSSELGAKDITEYFDFTLSKTKKMLTISAKRDENNKPIYVFDSNSQISINIYEDVCDTDGYNMNGKMSFAFTTGTKQDSLAPYIEKLSAGIGEDCLSFSQYTGGKTERAEFEAAAEAATNDLDNYKNTPILAQRVKDKVNIYVKAVDIAGSGGNVIPNQDNQSESDVALIQIRATQYINASGAAVTTSKDAFPNFSTGSNTTTTREVEDVGYAMGVMDANCQIKTKTFEQIIDTGDGTIFTYDLKELADGLIKIDIWAVDMVGNSGDTEIYKSTYGNGYRSIFVVKDKAAPDAAAAKSKIQITSKDDNGNNPAPYSWFNSNALSHMKIQDKKGDQTSNIIKDSNNEFLASDMNDLMWAFKLGNDTNWKPSASDTSIWSPIHQGGKPVIKAMSDAVVSADGPVYITMCIKDDLGNVSAPVVLDAINYDNTAPLLPSSVSWVDSNYNDIVATTDKADLSQSDYILKIPFTEEWAGLRRMKVTVNKKKSDGTYETTAIGQDSYKVRYVPASGSTSEISFVSGTINAPTVLNVSDSNKITTGTLYISGIKIGSQTGSYKVTVDLWDSSLNQSTTTSEISIDTTAPVIKKVYIPGLKQSITATSSSGLQPSTQDGWFLPREWIRGTNGATSDNSIKPGFIPLYIFVNEKDSGIKKIDFYGDHVILFNSASTTNGKTKLYKIENFGQQNESKIEIPEADYTVETKAIILKDNKTLKSSGDFVILVENAGFDSYRTTENTVKVRVYDLATLPSNDKEQISPFTDLNDTREFNVLADSYFNIENNTYTLKDCGYDAANGTSVQAQSGFTNEDSINLLINFKGENTSYSANSRYNRIKITGAKFTDSTEVTFDSTNIDYELSADKTEMTFIEKNNGAPTGKYVVVPSGAEITISDLKLDSNIDGAHKVKINVYDLAGWGWDVSPKEETITLDTTPPAWVGKGLYTGSYGDNKVYPHPAEDMSSEGLTLTGISGLYFYRGVSGIKINAKFTDANPRVDSSNNKLIRWSGGNISGTTIDDDYINGTLEGDFTANVYDKAGNKSEEIAFHIEYVNSLITSDDSRKDIKTNLENEVQLIVPEGADLQKNTFLNGVRSPEGPKTTDFDFASSQAAKIWVFNYVLKKFDGNYQLKVPVHNYAAGGAKTVPIEQYGVSHQYGAYPSDTTDCDGDAFIPKTPNWHDYKKDTSLITDGHLSSKVDENGDVIIILPNHNCPPVSLWLKDACGNTEFILLNPGLKDKLGTLTVCTSRPIDDQGYGKRNQAVAYVIDNRVGVNDSHNGTDSNEEKTYPTNTLVSKSDISFYKKNSSSELPELKLNSLSDSCRFPYESNYNGLADLENNPSDYTLKSKIIVWQGSGKPAYEKFYDSNISGSAWYAWKEFYDAAGAGSAFTLKNNFPEFDNAAHDSDKYELWYIIEDRVGNYEVRQIKNGSKTDWLYDVTPPKLDVKEATNVNYVDGKNYYSNSSSVKYSIEDKQSGIQNNGASAYDYSSFASRVQLYPESGLADYSLNGVDPASGGTISISGVKDWAENEAISVGLENEGSTTWVRQVSAPGLTTSGLSAKNTTDWSMNNSKYNVTCTPVENDITGGGVALNITSTAQNTNIDVTLKTSDTTKLLGWLISETKLTSFETFYSKDSPALTQLDYNESTNSYTVHYVKTNGNGEDDTRTAWNSIPDRYYYPVNRAGLVCQNPIRISFVEVQIPELNTNFTYSDNGTITFESGKMNYLKTGARFNFTATNNPEKCWISYGIGSDNKWGTDDDLHVEFNLNDYYDSTNELYSIPLDTGNLKTINNVALKIQLFTINESSKAYNLYGPASFNKWTFDETPPDLSISSITADDNGKTPAVEYSGKHYLTAGNKVIITFAYTAGDISKYQLKIGDGNWTNITLTQKKYTFDIPATETEYRFRSVDKAQNISAELIRIINQDKSAPTGNLSYTLMKGDNIAAAGTYFNDNGTIVYNSSEVGEIKFDFSAIEDAGSGIEGFYIKDGDGAATKLTSYTISLPVSDGATKTYNLSVKDNVGHERNLQTIILKADSKAPALTLTSDHPVQTKSDGNTYDAVLIGSTYYLKRANAIINFTKTATDTDIVKYEIKASGEEAYSDISENSNLKVTENSVSYTFAAPETTKAYSFRFTDCVGHVQELTELVSLVKDTTAPTAAISYKFTDENGNEVNQNFIEEVDAGDSNKITLKFNSNKIKNIILEASDILDGTNGSGVDSITCNGTNTLPLNGNGINFSLESDITYTIKIKDKAGNEATIKTLILKGFNGVKVQNTQHPPYSGLKWVPTYPCVIGDDANSNSNESKWILGYANDSNYTISQDLEELTDNPAITIWTYNNGKPEKLQSVGWNERKYVENVSLTLPFKKESLPSNELWYAITYHSIVEPSVWTAANASDIAAGKLSGITLNPELITMRHTFVFIWYKDGLGNISVYNLVYPKATNQNWWCSKASASNTPDPGDFEEFIYVSNGSQNSNAGNINANIRGSGLALLQGLVAASSPDTVERIENFSHFVVQLPMEPEESPEVTKTALVTKTAPVVKTAAPEVKPAPVVRTAAPVVKITAPEIKAAPTVKTAPEVKTTPIVKTAPTAKTAKQEVEEVPVTTDSVVEPQTALSGTAEGVTAAAREEKSSSKSALIVVMLAILSAAAGAWYLIKGRKQG